MRVTGFAPPPRTELLRPRLIKREVWNVPKRRPKPSRPFLSRPSNTRTRKKIPERTSSKHRTFDPAACCYRTNTDVAA